MRNNNATTPEIISVKTIMVKNPNGECPSGILSKFIPKKLAIIVGIDKTIVTVAKNFITIFKLLDITDANASIIPLKIPLY